MRTNWIRFPLAGAVLLLLATPAQAQTAVGAGQQQRHSNQDNGGPEDAPLNDPSTATTSGDPGRPWLGFSNNGAPVLGDPVDGLLFDAIFTDSRRRPRELPIRVDLESRLFTGARPEARLGLGPLGPESQAVMRPVRFSDKGYGFNPGRGEVTVPEPASALALGLGLAVLVRRRRPIQ